MRNQSEKKQTKVQEKAQKNTGDQGMIGMSFASSCLRGWREFSGSTTEQS